MNMKVLGLLFLLIIGNASLSYGALPIEQMLIKASQGSVKEQVLAGNAYAKGKGVARDYKKAFNWYQKAAEQGYGGGQRPLGVLYEFGRGVKKDAEKAAYWYEKAALQGVARAQVNLGILYETGLGVPKDLQKAFYWYEKAADLGYGRGMNQLAMLYEKGWGVKRDIRQALALYEKGASANYSKAMLNLGRLYSTENSGVSLDLSTAVSWYQKVVNLGFLDAEAELHRLQTMVAEQRRVEVVAEIVDAKEQMIDNIEEPPLSEKNVLLAPEVPAVSIKPPVQPSTETGEISLLVSLFVGSIVTISTVFIFSLLYLKKKTKNLDGGSPLVTELENDIKTMRNEIEQLSRVYKGHE